MGSSSRLNYFLLNYYLKFNTKMLHFFKLYILFFLLNLSCFANLETPTLVFPKNNAVLHDTFSVFKWDKLVQNNLTYTYNFEISDDIGFLNVLIQINGISANQLNVIDLPMNKKLYWRVKSFNGTVFSTWSTIWSFTTFTPSYLSNLKLWLKADKEVFKDASNNISQWNDQSGNNNHANQTTSVFQPKFIDSAAYLNNLPTIKLDGADDFLEILTNNSLDFANKLSGYFVTKRSLVGPHQTLLSKWNYPNDGSFAFQTYWDDITQLVSFIADSPSDPGNNRVVSNNANFNDTLYHNISIVFDGDLATNKLTYFNNLTSVNSSPTGIIASSLVNSNSNFYIGKFGGLGRFFSGNFSEIILSKEIYIDSINSLIHNYFINKYAPPVNLGENVFSSKLCDTIIGASNNFISYQWSTGATTPTISVNKSGKYWVNATNIFGKVSSDTIIVTYPKYEFKDSAFCQGNTIQWNTNLPKNQFSFLWQDGLTTDSVFNISQAGQYHVKIMDNFGCSIESDTITATIDDFKNTASLGPDTSLCSGNAIYLKQGLQSNLTYTWNTGSYNDSLYISSSGQYSAIITNSNNCVAKDTINVTVVGQAPTAAFLNSVACKNNVVTFTDNSSPPVGNTITSWFWNYGDGTTLADTSHLQNPFYTYADTGNYTVNLIINTDVGCKQTLVKNVHVAPTPSVNFNNSIACKNDSALFSNLSSSINYTPLTYSWNFGDPVSGITNNSSTLTNPKHLFSQQTTYPVKLITTNNAGCKDSLTKNISVKAQVTASFTNNSPCTNAPIIFQDNSIAPAPNNQNIRIWTIGSSTLTGLNATKSFTNPGVYPVTLTVNGSNGCVSSITKQIDVKLPPFADLSLSTICLNDTSKPTNLSVPQSGPITSWNWQNNNSTFSTAQTPCLIPTNPGNYNIKLVVGSSDNCKDSMTKQLTVLPLPNVDFVTNPSTFYYINSPITFSPTINTGSLYKWSIDGNLYTAPVTSVSFNSTGTHSASLYMRDAVGCANTKTKVLTVSGYLLDLAVIDIRSHKGTDNFISVEADLANFGTVPISNFEISYQVADAGFIKETWIGNLNPSAFMTYSFNSKSFQKNNTTNFITCVNIGLVNSIPDDVLSNNNLCIAANINDITVNDPSPNPTDGDINLSIVLPKTSSIIIELIDALGQIVYPEYTIHGDAGLNLISIPTTGFNRGSYVLKITIGDKIFIKKVLKVKQ